MGKDGGYILAPVHTVESDVLLRIFSPCMKRPRSMEGADEMEEGLG